MTPLGSLSGLILAGGRASRMQDVVPAAPGGASKRHVAQAPSGDTGIDKGLLMLGGEPLVARARRFLLPHVGTPYISANRYLAIYSQYGTVVPDDPDLGQDWGPLAGILAGLSHISTDWMVVVPVDVPFLPPDLIPRLASGVATGACLMAYADHEGAQPLCMILHKSLAPSLRQYLLDGGRAVQRWQKTHEAASIKFQGSDYDFFNINTPGDLCLAQQFLNSQNEAQARCGGPPHP